MTVSRRDVVRIGGLAATAVALGGVASCAGKHDNTRSSGSSLQIMWWGGDARTKAYQAAIGTYTGRHPSIAVKTQFSGYDGYFDKLDTYIAGDLTADIIQMDTELVSEYAGLGVLHPLDEHLGKQLHLGAFPEDLLAAGKVDGKLYGVPSGTGCMLVTYDATLLRDAGADPPPADWTWADLTAYATRLTKALGGKVHGVGDAGGDDLGAFQIFLREREKDLFTADGKLGFTAADLEEWLDYWDGMRRRKAAAPGEVTSAAYRDPGRNPLITGKVAMTFGVGLETSLPPLTDHELDFVPVPGGGRGSVEGQYLTGGVLLSVYARSEVTDEAADLIDYFANDTEAIKSMGLTRGVPPTVDARLTVAVQLGLPERRVLAAIDLVSRRVAAASAAPPPTPPKGAGQIRELLFENNLAVAFGRQTVSDATESFLAGAESALA